MAAITVSLSTRFSESAHHEAAMASPRSAAQRTWRRALLKLATDTPPIGIADAQAAPSVMNCHHGAQKPCGASGWQPRGTDTLMRGGAASSPLQPCTHSAQSPVRVALRGIAAAREAALNEGDDAAVAS